jgi:hypothetical protein
MDRFRHALHNCENDLISYCLREIAQQGQSSCREQIRQTMSDRPNPRHVDEGGMIFVRRIGVAGRFGHQSHKIVESGSSGLYEPLAIEVRPLRTKHQAKERRIFNREGDVAEH